MSFGAVPHVSPGTSFLNLLFPIRSLSRSRSHKSMMVNLEKDSQLYVAKIWDGMGNIVLPPVKSQDMIPPQEPLKTFRLNQLAAFNECIDIIRQIPNSGQSAVNLATEADFERIQTVVQEPPANVINYDTYETVEMGVDFIKKAIGESLRSVAWQRELT